MGPKNVSLFPPCSKVREFQLAQSSPGCLLVLTVDPGVPCREGVVCCARDHKEAFRCPTRLTFCFSFEETNVEG